MVDINPSYVLRSIQATLMDRACLEATNLAGSQTEDYTRRIATVGEKVSGGSFTGVELSGLSQAVDKSLVELLRKENGSLGKLTTLDKYYKDIQGYFGVRGTQSSFAHKGAQVLDAFTSLVKDPTSTSKRQEAITALDAHTRGMNTVTSKALQTLSLVDNDITDNVAKANGLLQRIATLNKSIFENSLDSTQSHQTLTYIDQRRRAIHDLSELVGGRAVESTAGQISFYFRNVLLVEGDQYATLNYTPTANPAPGQALSPLTVSSFGLQTDITQTIQQPLASPSESGNCVLGGLLHLRDQTLPGLIGQMDEYAVNFMRAVNEAHNQGTALNPPNELTGTIGVPGAGGALADALVISGVGTLRVGIIDSTNGALLSFKDVPLVNNMTVGNLRALLNAGPPAGGFNVDLTADGRLQITAVDPTKGVAIGSGDPLTQPRLNVGGAYNAANSYGASYFFGLNNILTGSDTFITATQAGVSRNITVRSDLLRDSSKLALGMLTSATPPDDPAITTHDISVVSQISNNLRAGKYQFNATSTSSAISTTLKEFSIRTIDVYKTFVTETETDLKRTKFSYEAASKEAARVSSVDQRALLQKGMEIATSQAIASKAMGLWYEMVRSLIEPR